VCSLKEIKMRKFLAVLVVVVGCFAWSNACIASGTCSVNDGNDIEYLIFWPPLPGGNLPDVRGIESVAARLGTTGDGKTRQLGVGDGIPVWASDESKIRQAINLRFDIAKQTNTAVHFLVDDHIDWSERPDLWNWYDPTRRGYNPDNRKNVEWYDWEGSPNKRRYFTPLGTASQTPHMCYNSPAIQKEIARIISKVVGPALRKEIDTLRQENKEYLFAGITVGAEAGIDDYSMIRNVPKIAWLVRTIFNAVRGDTDPAQEQTEKMLTDAGALMDEDKAPYSRLGYCALTNAGYSQTNPPKDINQALADINQKFIEFWDKQFVGAGIPCSRIYTHVAASPPQDDNNNSPLGIVFNPYARPGWTTYPLGTLANRFQPLYDELAKHGNPAWGGVEANNAGFANPNAPGWEEYLGWHYNHGAKFVGINVGASDQSIMSNLSKGASSDEAMAAYKKFLKGEKLIEK
jgi:hypothetical protein